jgi:hypothetical protein
MHYIVAMSPCPHTKQLYGLTVDSINFACPKCCINGILAMHSMAQCHVSLDVGKEGDQGFDLLKYALTVVPSIILWPNMECSSLIPGHSVSQNYIPKNGRACY